MSETWDFIIQSWTAGVRVMKRRPGLQNLQCSCGQNYGVFHKKKRLKWHLQPILWALKEVCLYQGDLLLRSWCFLSQFPSAPRGSKTQHMLCASCAGLHTLHVVTLCYPRSLPSTRGAEFHWAGNSRFSKCIVNLVTICNLQKPCSVLWQWIRQGSDFSADPVMFWKPYSSWVYKAWDLRIALDLVVSCEHIPTQFPHQRHLHLQVSIADQHKV